MAHCRQERPADWNLETVAVGTSVVVCQVAVGLGGVGKTQLAAGLAHRMSERREVDLLVWVSATSRSAVLTAYTQAAADIAGVDDTVPDQAASRFLAWLATTSHRWLIVLDDVTDPQDLRGLCPPTTVVGRTVVTTRSTDSALIAGRCRIDVGVFTPAESAAYLTAKFAACPARLEGAVELADDLGHLPLALAQAAAYILDRTGMACAGYRRRLADRRQQLAILAPQVLPDDYPYPVATTWLLSIERADERRPCGLARPVLELMALLDPNGIPVELLTTPTVLSYLKARIGGLVEFDDITDSLDNLALLSLATVDPESGTARVHALLQRVVREATPTDHTVELATTAANALQATWPRVERDREHAQALRANAAALHTHTGPLLWDQGAYPVLFVVGRSLGDTGQVTATAEYFQALHAATTHYLGADHPDALTSRNNLATWRGEAGDPAGAAVAYAALLADRLRIAGPDHSDTLTTRHDLAYWRGRAGDTAGATTEFAELLTDQLRVLGPDHPSTLTTRHDLAYWRGLAGDAAGATTANDELLPDFLRVFGPDHPDTLTTRNNLAYWRGQAGDLAGAITAYEQLLTDRLRILAPDHPATLTTRNSLASYRGDAGDPVGAIALLEELLIDRLRVLGPDHPDTLTTRNNLAYWRGQAGDLAGAITAYEQLLIDSVRILAPDHPATLTTRNSLASYRGDAGDPVGAIALLEELLIDRLRVLGPDHPDTLTTRNNLAINQGEAGDPAHAIAALETLLADSVRTLGTDHLRTLTIRHNLADWHGLAGDAVGATTAYQRLIADLLRVLGPGHPNTGHACDNLRYWSSAARIFHSPHQGPESASTQDSEAALLRATCPVAPNPRG